MLKGVMLSDRIQVPSKRVLKDSGQMHVPCKFARTGTQLYTADQLGLTDVNPNKIIKVTREAGDVFDEESVASFRSAPVTIGHPLVDGKPVQVTSENAKELQVGMLEGMPVRDEDTLGGTLILSNQEAIDVLDEGTQELSAGYTCDIEMSDNGDFFQRNIRANHIAIVAKGRAGSSCRISDNALDVVDLVDADLVKDHLGKVSDNLTLDSVKDDLGEAALVKLTVEDGADGAALLKAMATALKSSVETVDHLKVDMAELNTKLTGSNKELADAKLAASQDVVARCKAMENARLVADMRDLGDKTVEEIHKLVVADQMPDRNLEGKPAEYVEAMFDLLVDSASGTTPMSKLLGKVDLTVDADLDKESPVDAARQRMVERQNKA